MFDELSSMMFAGASSTAGPVVGQIEFNATTTWIVPADVFMISMAAIGASGAGFPTIDIAGVGTVCRAAPGGSRIGDGGGDGGPGAGLYYDGVTYYAGGGGGAGGYSGNGGSGGSFGYGTNGSGGGGGGGSCAGISGIDAFGGGGVGLLGEGASGLGGYSGGGGSGGGTSNSPNGGLYGGGYGGDASDTFAGGEGGSLAYKNNVAVTPGQVITINLPTSFYNGGIGSRPGARIMWGGGRSYPSNAGNL